MTWTRLGSLVWVASVVMICACSTKLSSSEALPQATSTRVPGLTLTASPGSPSIVRSPTSISTPVPLSTPTATPLPTATTPPPSPAVATVSTPTAAEGPSVPPEATGTQPATPPSGAAGGEQRLAVVRDGDWTFIRNGDTVNLGQGGLSAQLVLIPYPPTRLTALLDLYLTAGGEPVTSAGVNATYDMKGMTHGPFNSVAKSLGNGHYQLSLEYIEFGAWEHKLVIYLPEAHYDMGVGTVVFPG